jgi:hypothetical protein
MAATSTLTLHRRLERLQSALHRHLSDPLRQTGATMGPQFHQAPGGRNSPVVPQKVPDHEKSNPRGRGGGSDRGLLQRIQQLGLRPHHITEGADYLRETVPGSRPLHHRRRASSGPHRRSEACTSSTTTRYEPAARQTLGEEASRRSSCRRTTRLSRPGRTSRRRTHAGRHPRRSMPVPQRHAPHPSELQRLQALRRARPTLPTSTSSSAAGRTRRTATTPATGGGRRWSLPARRQRGQRHLQRTRIAGEQKTTKAQRSPNTGGNHRSSCSVPMVGAPDHLHSGRSVAQLRPPRQIPAPYRSGDPREQGEEGISGRGEQHQRHLPPDTLRLGSSPQRAPRVRYSILRYRAD